MASVFSHDIKIRFAHCDPAGIVYFPRFFDMFQTALEEWYASMGEDYAQHILARRIGTPIVHAECDFFIPSRLGDVLTMTPLIRKIGRTSLQLTIHGHVGAQERLRGSMAHTFVDMDKLKSLPIPDDMRRKFEAYQAASEGWSVSDAA